ACEACELCDECAYELARLRPPWLTASNGWRNRSAIRAREPSDPAAPASGATGALASAAWGPSAASARLIGTRNGRRMTHSTAPQHEMSTNPSDLRTRSGCDRR